MPVNPALRRWIQKDWVILSYKESLRSPWVIGDLKKMFPVTHKRDNIGLLLLKTAQKEMCLCSNSQKRQLESYLGGLCAF